MKGRRSSVVNEFIASVRVSTMLEPEKPDKRATEFIQQKLGEIDFLIAAMEDIIMR